MADPINYDLLNKDPEWPAYLSATEQANGLPQGLLQGIYQVESSGGRKLTSNTNVQGPFQITKGFWKDFGGDQPYSTDPLDQATVAARGLAHHIQQFGGDVNQAVNFYRNGSLAPNDPLADPKYVQKVNAVMNPNAQAGPGTKMTDPGATPGTLRALGDSTKAYANDWYNTLREAQTMDLSSVDDGVKMAGHVVKLMTPVVAPLAMAGRIMAGTAARRAGSSDTQTQQAEDIGELLGGGAHIINAAGGIRNVINGGMKLLGLGQGANITEDTMAAARAYYEPLRQRLERNPQALKAVEAKIERTWGPGMVDALNDPTPPPSVALPTNASKAYDFIQSRLQHGVRMGIGAGVGHLLGDHAMIGAALGEAASPITDILATPATRVLMRSAANPPATMSVMRGVPSLASRLDQPQQQTPVPRADGGPVNAGQQMLVGENGPEVLQADQPTNVRKLMAPGTDPTRSPGYTAPGTPAMAPVKPRTLAPSGGGVTGGMGILSPEDAARSRAGGTVVVQGPDGRFQVVPR